MYIEKAMLYFFLICFPMLASGYQLSTTEINLGGDNQKRYKLRISNDSDTTSYVKVVDMVRVDNPGTPQQTEVPVENKVKPELMVTPQMLIIPPKADVDIIVVDMLERKVEAAYYFTLMPVSKPGDGVSLSFAYRVLVRAVPKEIRSNYIVNNNNKEVVISNDGNTRVSLEDIRLCKESEPSSCDFLERRNVRVYPGNKYLIAKKNGYKILFDITFPDFKQYEF